MDADGTTKKKAEKDKKSKKDSGRARWAVQVFCISVVLSGALSFASDICGIISVAVTAADEKPFHSMAAHRTPGAKEALGLIRQASKVSSFCNDVVGDICGIISGSTAAVIVVRLQSAFSLRSALISLAVTALVSGLTIGGKAMGKAFAIDKSTAVLQLVGRALHLFSGKKK